MFIIMSILCSGIHVSAQPTKISFDDMWSIALDKNLQIRNATLLIEKSGTMQRSAWDFGPLEFNFIRGQQNSELIDNMYDVRQGLGTPFTISATRKYYNSEQDFYYRHAMQVSQEIKKQLRSLYYEWLYEKELVNILDQSIGTYQKSVEYAEMQYETGDSNLLSKVMLSSELQKLVIRKDLHKVNMNSLKNQIQTLLNTDSTFIPLENSLNKLMIVLPENMDGIPVDSVPDVVAIRSYVEVMNHLYKMEKSRISPSFSAGYYSQEINHEAGFQGWQIGVSFPLLFMPQKARSQAAHIEFSRSENKYMYEKLKAKKEIDNLIAKYEQLQKSIQYYEEERLNNADLIEQNANLLYESGSIGYIEFVGNQTISRQIREDYIHLIHEYNQFVIELYYYLDN